MLFMFVTIRDDSFGRQTGPRVCRGGWVGLQLARTCFINALGRQHRSKSKQDAKP